MHASINTKPIVELIKPEVANLFIAESPCWIWDLKLRLELITFDK